MIAMTVGIMIGIMSAMRIADDIYTPRTPENQTTDPPIKEQRIPPALLTLPDQPK